MNVDRDNFDVQFPLIREKIKNATFIAFDEEMTGIFPTDPTKRNAKTDDAYSRFAKMTSVSSHFCIMQFGLCIFTRKSDTEYEVSPYNFLVFPSSPNTEVIMSASTVDFHRKNNLDFQKWVYKGLPFVDSQGQIALEKKYNQDPSVPTTTTPSAAEVEPTRVPLVLTRPADIEYLERNVKELRAMMDRPSDGPNSDTVVNEYTFEPSNAYLRRAVYEYLEVHCPASHYIITKTPEQCIKVKKVPAIVKQDYDNFVRADNKAKFQQEMGFRLVFNELARSKKPLVGHNCTFDLMFLLQWLDRPLEPDFDAFRARLNTLLPTVFDTKYIATSGLLNGKVFEDTMLESLYRQMKGYLDNLQGGITVTSSGSSAEGSQTSISGKRKLNEPTSVSFRFASDSPGYITGSVLPSTEDTAAATGSSKSAGVDTASKPQFHDAGKHLTCIPCDCMNFLNTDYYYMFILLVILSGWDAYCTGLVFATELQMMQSSVESLHSQAANKMFMMQSMYHMDLDPMRPGSILKARGPVYYLFDFPAQTSVPDILAAFTALGHRKEDLELTWVDGTSTFVTIAGPLPTPEADIVSVYAGRLPVPWKIQTLAQFRARQAPGPDSQDEPATAASTGSLWSWMSYLTAPFTSAGSNPEGSSQSGKKRKL